jgi:hypothetical protein
MAGGLDQAHPLQACMLVLADDDIVVHGDAKRGGDIDDRSIARPIALTLFDFGMERSGLGSAMGSAIAPGQ